MRNNFLSQSKIAHTALLTAVYVAACFAVFDWRGVLSRALIFSVCLAAVLLAEKTESILNALRVIHAKTDRLYFVLFFTCVTVAFGLYYGYGLLRTWVEAMLAFMFFLAFSAIGNHLNRNNH